jgi:hypothetical protein
MTPIRLEGDDNDEEGDSDVDDGDEDEDEEDDESTPVPRSKRDITMCVSLGFIPLPHASYLITYATPRYLPALSEKLLQNLLP